MHRISWRLAAGACSLVVAGSTVASAAPDGESCESDGVDVSYRTSGLEVTAVTLSGVGPSCTGDTAVVTLSDGAGRAVGTTDPTPVTGSTMTLAVRRARIEDVAKVSVVIHG